MSPTSQAEVTRVNDDNPGAFATARTERRLTAQQEADQASGGSVNFDEVMSRQDFIDQTDLRVPPRPYPSPHTNTRKSCCCR